MAKTLSQQLQDIEDSAASVPSKQHDGAYVIRAFAAIDRIHQNKDNRESAVRQRLTIRCPECGDHRGDDSLTYDFDEVHLVHRGWVVIGCEGYLVIDPQALGLDRGNWQDWVEDHDVPAVPKTEQDARDFVWWLERTIGGGFHPDTPADQYIHIGGPQDGTPLYTKVEERLLQAGLDATFALLEDIYAVSCDAVQFLAPDGWDLDDETAEALAVRAQEAQVAP
jgi:hypothetical protein